MTVGEKKKPRPARVQSLFAFVSYKYATIGPLLLQYSNDLSIPLTYSTSTPTKLLHPLPYTSHTTMSTPLTTRRALSQLRLHLHLRLPTTTITQTQTRKHLSTSASHNSAWSTGPSPPRLPKSEQEIYEQLQKQSTGAFSTPTSKPKVVAPKINQSPESSASPTPTASAEASPEKDLEAKVSKGEELHPNIRRGAPPEFEGEVNPKTGEVGGPKNEPLRWGHQGDWSYNGRATDF